MVTLSSVFFYPSLSQLARFQALKHISPSFWPRHTNKDVKYFFLIFFGFYVICHTMKHILVFFLACCWPRLQNIFKVPVTLSLCQHLAIVQLVLRRNYLQCLASLKLGVNTKFFWGFHKQQKNPLRGVNFHRCPFP